MEPRESSFVAKVHPLDRPPEADDPFELMAEPVAGDPIVMLDCMLQEFLWMGWDEAQLVSLFHNPGYPVLVQLREYFGDDFVRQQVSALVGRTGVLRFRETIAEPDEECDGEDQSNLVQLKLNIHGH